MTFTLCIPTKNRPGFVARLLGYYARTGFRHALLVGDASEGTVAEQTQAVCRSFADRLRVQYIGQTGLHVMATLEHLSAAASSRYCSWVSDDDFLCTSSIDRCIAFLEHHPEYAAAQGRGILFQTDTSRPHGSIGNVTRYPYAQLEAERAEQRLREHVHNGMPSLHAAVRRIEDFHEMVGGLSDLPGARQGFIFDDVIPQCVAATQGKIKTLDCLYLVRHAHDGIYRQVDAYDWVTDPDWGASYQRLQDRVVEGLMRHDGLTVEEARRIMKEAFWPYLARFLTRSLETSHGARRPLGQGGGSVRAVAKRIPGVRWGWRSMRAMIQRCSDELSLPALLQPSAPYHDDFMPVYHAVQTPPVDVWREREPVEPMPRTVAGLSA